MNFFQITHLDFVATNPSYRSIDSIYADNNRIESITELDGSVFIYKFVRLSLRNNNIKIVSEMFFKTIFWKCSILSQRIIWYHFEHQLWALFIAGNKLGVWIMIDWKISYDVYIILRRQSVIQLTFLVSCMTKHTKSGEFSFNSVNYILQIFVW